MGSKPKKPCPHCGELYERVQTHIALSGCGDKTENTEENQLELTSEEKEKGYEIIDGKKYPPHWFKPGESGNPDGKPKGTLNFNTRVDMAIGKLAEMYVKEHNRKVDDPDEPESEEMDVDDVDIEGAIFQKYLERAVRGEPSAQADFLNRRFGKPTQNVKHSGVKGEPIEYRNKSLEEARETLLEWQEKWSEEDGDTPSSPPEDDTKKESGEGQEGSEQIGEGGAEEEKDD